AMNDKLRMTLQGANLVLASGTAWARVESGKHYPSDVLAGAALGRVISIFVHDVLMDLPETEKLSFNFFINKDEQIFLVEFTF
ncbi:MAG: phosphatase PAP2 family protein, partial [Lentisphaeraceae bacterium]|nr:phosphatase PAP2 family protein [Lentisphaeraceae bacterium]